MFPISAPRILIKDHLKNKIKKTTRNRKLTPETQDYSIPDPELTPLGKEQAAALSAHLQKRLPGSLDPELIIVSPFRRCLQTATIAFDWLIDAESGRSKVPMVANASWQGKKLFCFFSLILDFLYKKSK